MIINIKKRDLIIAMCILLIIPAVFAAQVARNFTVTVSMINRGPSIISINVTNVTLIAGQATTVSVAFNASDGDGFGDLDDSTAEVNITYNGVTRTSSSCTPTDYNLNYTEYSCSVTFNYFDNASTSWTVNATVSDNSGNKSINDTEPLEVKSTSSMEIVANLTFSNAALGEVDKASDSNFILNNTGNFDFTTINITGYELRGISDVTETIGAGNFTVNITNAVAGDGMPLQNATSLAIDSATLPHNNFASDVIANETLYFWMDVPLGIAVQNYNSTIEWAITVE